MKALLLGFVIALIFLLPLHAQTATKDLGNANTAAAAPSTPAATQAPEEMTRKIADLVNAGKYAEAQQLTTGLLVVYPDDQRLIKAKTLIENLLEPGVPPNAPQKTPHPAHPAANNGEEFTGMEKMESPASTPVVN